MDAFYDFHLHSCLSPCGSDDMTPNNIVNMAALLGYSVIAVSDHNAVGNVESAMAVGKAAGVLVVPAMELNCLEEVHVLCLFRTLEGAKEMEKEVRRGMPPVKNDADAFGNQLLLDENDELVGREETLLITASAIGVYDVQAVCRSFGGVAIPAHIDRSSYSVLSSLGFLTPDMDFGPLELSRRADRDALLRAHPDLRGRTFLTDSDAHYLDAMAEPRHTIPLERFSAAGVVDYFTGLFPAG